LRFYAFQKLRTNLFCPLANAAVIGKSEMLDKNNIFMYNGIKFQNNREVGEVMLNFKKYSKLIMIFAALAGVAAIAGCAMNGADSGYVEDMGLDADSKPEHSSEPLQHDIPNQSTQPALPGPESANSRFEFDDIIKNISGGNMTYELIYESRTDAKISRGNDIYYPVNPNRNSDIRISPLDSFMKILENCEYIETDSFDEPIIYTFIFSASDMNGEKNEICVYVTHSCVRFAYNGISDGKEYANTHKTAEYKNICGGYDFYIEGIIPDENGQLATIW